MRQHDFTALDKALSQEAQTGATDPRLTAGTYTDTKRLGLRAAVGKLSLKAAQTDSQIDLQKIVGSGHSVSSPVTNGSLQEGHKTPANTGEKSLPVTYCHTLAMNGGMVRAAGFEPATPTV